MTKNITPTINGFSIKSVQTMPSEEGYAVYCKVYFNNKKIGDFVDKGDGGEYSFYADRPYDTAKIEKVVRSFPTKNRDYGLGLMDIPYDMCQMVDDLMEMKEISKALNKLDGTGRDYVVIDEWKTNRHLNCSPSKMMSDEELNSSLRKQLLNMGLIDCEIRRFRGAEDLQVVNTFVTEDILK